MFEHKYSEPHQFRSFIVSLLRKGSLAWPPRAEAFKRAYVGQMRNKSTGRMAAHYRCAGCQGLFPMKECHADHIDPVISVDGFVDWNTYIERMFCPVDNFQILCKPCHLIETNRERRERKK